MRSWLIPTASISPLRASVINGHWTKKRNEGRQSKHHKSKVPFVSLHEAA
jgi:hypothetical protein